MTSSETGWVDTHFHVINRKQLTYGWLDDIGEPWTGILGDYSELVVAGDFTLDDYLALALPSGVTKLVHVEAAFGSDPAAESAWIQHLADRSDMPIAIIGHAALDQADIGKVLDRQLENSNFRGIRMLGGAAAATSPWFMNGFGQLVDRDLCFEEPFAFEYASGIASLARAFEDARIVVGHCGMPMRRDPEGWSSWLRAMQSLSRYENVYCKISGVHMTDHHWTFDSVRRVVETCIETFAPQRCFFGSNWPVESLYGGTIVDLVSDYHRIIATYSQDEQIAMLSANASRFYRI